MTTDFKAAQNVCCLAIELSEVTFNPEHVAQKIALEEALHAFAARLAGPRANEIYPEEDGVIDWVALKAYRGGA